ncbi:MAG: S8 family serine peptidase [Actinomycetota bacterium]
MAVAVSVGIGVVNGGAAGAQDEPENEDLWAVVQDADGGLEVVRGEDALQAVSDDMLGRTESEVLSIQEDGPVHALGTNDAYRSQQYALDIASFEASWTTTRGTGVIVAVVDTGVRGDHEDLAPIVVSGTDYVDGGSGLVDPNGHGTHVAGIIGAVANNGVGIAGGAPDVRIMSVRVLNAQGSGSSSNVAAGIIYAADHGARVINLSLGGGGYQGMEDAVNYAVGKGALVLAAAGNSGIACEGCIYPAGYANAIAVAALDSNKNRASFSNYGSLIDIAAPGVNITSTYSRNTADYVGMSGTSMSTPYASAAAALVIAANPAQTAAQARAALEAGADDLGSAGWDPLYGNGFIDPRDSVTRALPAVGGSVGAGYWVADRDGEVHAFGAAPHLGQPAGLAGMKPIVAMAATPSGNGYWVVGEDGAVYAYGDAGHFGGLGGQALNAPIVAMARTASGQGYFLLGRDGGVFAYGDAQFRGSTGGMKLNAAVLDMTVSPAGTGYWFVGGDGGVFSFGAPFYGSTGSMKLAAPVMSMTSNGTGTGYWMIGFDGGVFAFGEAPFHGSLPGLKQQLGLPTTPAAKRLRGLADGSGYYMLGFDGSVWAFGRAKYHGGSAGDAVDLALMPW